MNLDSLSTKLRNQLTTWVPWMNTKLAHYYLYAQYTQSRDKKSRHWTCLFLSKREERGRFVVCVNLYFINSIRFCHPQKTRNIHSPFPFFFNPSLSRICWWKPCQCGNSRLRRRVCVCLVRLPVQATLTVIYLQQEHTHTEMMEGVSTGGDRLSVAICSPSSSLLFQNLSVPINSTLM